MQSISNINQSQIINNNRYPVSDRKTTDEKCGEISYNLSYMSHEISNSIKVSVIVPVYKVERYLAACLDSLMAQSMEDIEILLIDDGSPDACGRICDEYAAKDARFHAFHTENHGLSAARNYGIERASGEYLMFVDSDDWVSPEFCAAAYDEAVEHTADLVMFRFQPMKGRRKARTKRIKDEPGFKTQEEAIDLILDSNGNYAWNKLYKRVLFESVRYPEGRVYEDVATTYKLIYQAERIWYTDRVLYYYRLREGSITHDKSREMFRESFSMGIEQRNGLADFGYPVEKQDSAMQNNSMGYCIKMGEDDEDEYSVHAQNWLDGIEGIPRIFTWKRKVLLVIYRISPRLFDLICIVFGRRLRK